jgi:rRNA-processing protein FCF1
MQSVKKIILDTNFLLIPEQFNVDIFSEIDRISNFKYKLLVFDRIIGELENITRIQRRKYSKAAKLALQLIKSKKYKIFIKRTDSSKSVDNLILDFAVKEGDCIVATQDVLLKQELKKKKVPIITLTQKNYVKLIR